MTQSKSDNWVRIFHVNDPKRHKNGFIIYKVTSVVFPKNAPEAVTNIVVWKRFNDFKKLHSSLKIHHRNCNISEDIPKLSKAKHLKRFEEDVIQERIKCLLELLNFIGRHPSLFTCAPFIQFFNNSYQISDTVNAPVCVDNGNAAEPTRGCASSFPDAKLEESDDAKKESTSEDRCVRESDNSDGSGDESSSGTSSPAADAVCGEALRGADESIASLPNRFGKMVTCHMEKPIKDGEVWVCVHAHDLRSRSRSPGERGNPPFDCDDDDDDDDDYLIEAAKHAAQARSCEVSGEYEAAFAFYKAAVACLFSGISEEEEEEEEENGEVEEEEDDRERRLAIEEKIRRYAERAESVYARHLSARRREEEEEAAAVAETPTSSADGLRFYKVVAVIDDKVILATNTLEDKEYVIKAVEKSPCPVDATKRTIIPCNVPYMVRLVRYFESDDSIYLVLEHARGGRLWDHVERCFRTYDDDEDAEEVPRGEKWNFEMATMTERGTRTAKTVSEVEDAEDAADADDEVANLVKNSQRLLESISNTLERSDHVTSNLSEELKNVERALEKEMPERDAGGTRMRSASVARSMFDRRFSSEDARESSRSRTASTGLDGSGRRSRLASMIASAPVLSESRIRAWAAEMFVALETLHEWGIICGDLHPGNVLLDESGHLLLTYQMRWRGTDSSVSEEAARGYYAAPEATKIFPITAAADWWSFGALLYELFTGKALSSCHPGGILGHTILTFPEFLSPEACSLLTELLRYEPSERLGGGVNGSDDIKCHPFFGSVDWHLLYNNDMFCIFCVIGFLIFLLVSMKLSSRKCTEWINRRQRECCEEKCSSCK